MKRLSLLIFSLSFSVISADEKTISIPPQAIKKALLWMQDAEPSKRAAAYRTFHAFGDEGGEIYRNILDKAKTQHEKRVAALLKNKRLNPFGDFEMEVEEFLAERKRVYDLIKIDYKKDPDKIAMLRNEVAKIEKTIKSLRRTASKDSAELEKTLATIGTSLAEIERELKILDKEEFDDALDPDAALAETYEGGVYLQQKAALEKVRGESKLVEKIRKENDAFAWPNGAQKQFAHHLNENRSLFGLTPLLLEEKLSDAAVGHSEDMATVGFFAHQSPVEGKTSPGDRAKLAGFKHSWTGENIYVGSTSPVEAYNAWFGSDGHRFIMYANGPNLLGIGPHGRHWTMMTGRKR